MFYSQVTIPPISIYMQDQQLKQVTKFKYLGFTWIVKLSTQLTVNKLNWLRCKHLLLTKVLRKCFFACTFPHFARAFPLFPSLPPTQQEILRRKYGATIRIVHWAPFVPLTELFSFTEEDSLDQYVRRYIKKRLTKIYTTDLLGFLPET